MLTAEQFVFDALEKRKQNKALRSLSQENNKVDFCSNDYLGLAKSAELRNNISKKYAVLITANNGSGGSRLLSGNTAFAETLEKSVANFHYFPAALVFNSGYDANLGIFSSLPKRGDTVLYDELVHASIRDGIRLSFADSKHFKHNDLLNLEDLLKKAKGVIYVAVESVYSMDGDGAPLAELVALCEKYKANLIVDEAHAIGIFGVGGRGKVAELNVQKKVFATLYTFGKALGCHGAAVCGSEALRTYLINFARSFIYTTALPSHSLLSIQEAYGCMEKADVERKKLQENIQHFKKNIDSGVEIISSESAIQCVIIPGNEAAKNAANALQNEGFDVRAILSPTVPLGEERLRICLHAFNTETEIIALAKKLNSMIS